MSKVFRPHCLLTVIILCALAIFTAETLAATPYPTNRSRHALPWSGKQRDATHTKPHPAVARIIAPEEHSLSFGSGTLVDVRGEYGLVVTNWHVVRDAQGAIDVIFPDGFRSQARALKLDPDWDLAALVIWRPPIEPVQLAQRAPRPGDPLTICGYGPGTYRAARGRCTQYYAPRPDFPMEMVELSVAARQGDSGGPILNERGELAGVLFGAGEGTTIGSFGGRVEHFLASLTRGAGRGLGAGNAPDVFENELAKEPTADATSPFAQLGAPQRASEDGLSVIPLPPSSRGQFQENAPPAAPDPQPLTWHDLAGHTWIEQAKSALALLGLASLGAALLRRMA